MIAYRQRQESLIERVKDFSIKTASGPATAYTYRTPWDPMQHLAIVFGDIRDGKDIFVRFHTECVVEDVFGTFLGLGEILDRLASTQRGACGVSA